MIFTDSHAHVDGPEFDADRDEVLARARAAGVQRMVVIGAVGDPSSAERSVALAERDPDVWATVATHPHDVEKMTPEWWAVHERLAPHPRVVAIGETGLDYYYDHSPREAQKRRVRALHRARAPRGQAGRLPHPRRPRRARAILAEEGARASVGVRDPLLHRHARRRATRTRELGCYVSFSGIVTYKTAQPIRDAVPLVPRDRILIETDCPYLAPIPKRGKRNEPALRGPHRRGGRPRGRGVAGRSGRGHGGQHRADLPVSCRRVSHGHP